MMRQIPRRQVELNFEPSVYERGLDYMENGRVLSAKVSPQGRRVTSEVLGRNKKVYQTDIEVTKGENLAFYIEGECTCPVRYNCKHVVATALSVELPSDVDSYFSEVSAQKPQGGTLSKLDKWVENLEKANLPPAKEAPQPYNRHLLYELKFKTLRGNKFLIVELKSSRILKKGGYGVSQKWHATSYGSRDHLQEIDEEIVSALMFLEGKFERKYGYLDSQYALMGEFGEKVLENILSTERCYWEKAPKCPLSLVDGKSLAFNWEVKPNGNQALKPEVDGKEALVFSLARSWFVDPELGTCGPLACDLEPASVNAFLNAPDVPPEKIELVSKKIKKIAPKGECWLPKVLDKPKERKGIKPTPVIGLDAVTIKDEYPYFSEYLQGSVEVSFDYDGVRLPFSFANKNKTISYTEGKTPYKIVRDLTFEKETLLALGEALPLMPSGELPVNGKADRWYVANLDCDEAFEDFSMVVISQLEAFGFKIERKHPAFVELLFDEDVSWYSELDEQSEYDYFNFTLGIEIEGEKINILPVVASLLNTRATKELRALADDETVPLLLPNSRVLAVPFARIKPILNILIELYDSDPKGLNEVKLSTQHAALLHEIKKAFAASSMRWLGSQKLSELGKELANFKGIKSVKVPKLFTANLRDYQKHGVNWMQFLRQYKLGGVLADDMGLGKTVQTLAHLCTEKNRRRMKKPSLIVAPTSLMVNWRQEANRFAPNLKVLVHHGEERHFFKDEFNQYNVILTTYSLLARDKKLLLEQDFYYLILDEAQYIKNTKAKSTQIIHQIKAEHRLCLTGTPMENHLGELWSLFHFLMPGFLGNEKQFKQVFRTPIEKNKDQEKQKALALRVKPFMLRRLKDEVVLELPKKTEIIRTVDLTTEQKDLYESIRLSMEKKVRDAINKKGLSRSHIIILDALLKLRQTCCHPQLLTLPSARRAYQHSAKFDLLMEMLPQMIEEGRRVLVFSQFTKMLLLIEQGLKERGISFVKLTGATRNREKVISSFQSGDVPVFLISLKAGGTGLNLTAADSVIHFDPWWNPAVEDQASDRSHRIGQDKPVFVYKLLTSGTIEETIQEMQQKKRALMNGLFSEQEERRFKLNADDLQSLFKPIA